MDHAHPISRLRAWALAVTALLLVMLGGAGAATAHDGCTDPTCDTSTTTSTTTTTFPTTTTTAKPTTTTTDLRQRRPPPSTTTPTTRPSTTTTTPVFGAPPAPPPEAPAPAPSSPGVTTPARATSTGTFVPQPSADPPGTALPVVTPAFPNLDDHTANSLVTARLATGGATGDDWSVPWEWIGGGVLGFAAVAALLRVDRRWSRR